MKEKKLNEKIQFIESTKTALVNEFGFDSEPSSKQLEDASERLYNIYQLRASGQLLSEARIQTTFNTLYDLKLQAQKIILILYLIYLMKLKNLLLK